MEAARKVAMEAFGWWWLVVAGTTGMLVWGARLATLLWWGPRGLERSLRAQGLRGNRYRFPSGDLGEEARLLREALARPLPLLQKTMPRASPLLYRAITQYGKSSITWFGPVPRVTITNPDLVHEILSTKFGHFEKPKISSIRKLVVTGLVHYEHKKWAKHRRIINPAFHLEKLKNMQPAFSSCCSEMIRRWERLVESSGAESNGNHELNVWAEFQNLTVDVISKAAFGSSCEEGRRIFKLQSEQAQLILKSTHKLFTLIPGFFRFLPTPVNRRSKQIERELRLILRGMIEKREEAVKIGEKNGGDLLSLLIESNLNQFANHGESRNCGMTTEDVIDECKLFYFAGQETTSSLLNWTIVLLSMFPSWQEKAREEVMQVYGQNAPDFYGLSRLNIMNMILHEVLRLYPPASHVARSTYKSMELGKITYPKGVMLCIPIIFIHRDPEIWGEDADEFKPERFAKGVSNATKNNQMAFFPFGWGPRICIGQNFAMFEAKMCLSMILQRFSFKLSPSYIHAPYMVITLQPQHGTQVVIRRI